MTEKLDGKRPGTSASFKTYGNPEFRMRDYSTDVSINKNDSMHLNTNTVTQDVYNSMNKRKEARESASYKSVAPKKEQYS